MTTHRCRVYLGPQKWASNVDHVELWDTLDDPYELSGAENLPDGEPLETFTGQTFGQVRAAVNEYEFKEGLVRGVDWEIRGL